MYFMHLLFSEISVTIFSKLLLECAVFTDFMLIWV